MIKETKTLLQQIQQDVNLYMEKLSKMENQITLVTLEKDKEDIEDPEEEISKQQSIRDIETEVDEFLSRLDDKNKENYAK